MLLPSATPAAAPYAQGCVVAQLLFWTLWFRIQLVDPGFLPGSPPEDEPLFWSALEKLPPAVPVPPGFCERSEQRRQPRSAFSRLLNGRVAVMDHDCPWVGTCIGAGNNASFALMLLCGEAGLCLWQMAHFHSAPPAPHETWLGAAAVGGASGSALGSAELHARLMLYAAPLMLMLHLILTPLLLVHCHLVAANVTTNEMAHWKAASHGRVSLPLPGTRAWKLYAPYDQGAVRNVIVFFRGRRRPDVCA